MAATERRVDAVDSPVWPKENLCGESITLVEVGVSRLCVAHVKIITQTGVSERNVTHPGF